MGNGSFVIPLIEKFMSLHQGDTRERLQKILTHNLVGIEIDKQLYVECLERIKARWGCLPSKYHLFCKDFFHISPHRDGTAFSSFDFIVGNPPFGGTIDPSIQDRVDRELGFRYGYKIKKETYAFFIVKGIDLLSNRGILFFICSDTFLTIKTMQGLRMLLLHQGETRVNRLNYFSDETKHGMVLLDFHKGKNTRHGVFIDDALLMETHIRQTPHHSWGIDKQFIPYFAGPLLGDYLIATSGMTVGKNEYFVRRINEGKITEKYHFSYYERPVTLADEISKARLGKLSKERIAQLRYLESSGATVRDVQISMLDSPEVISLPNPDYCYYNKAVSKFVYCSPSYAVYWKNQGEAVMTFKKNGNWYLRGVGGGKFFLRSGLTWKLIARRLYTRVLPQGYILDGGAPCAFLRPGVDRDELLFILGWTLTQTCNLILKRVINHTKNIQGKDFERLPYPYWVSGSNKAAICRYVDDMIRRAMQGYEFTEDAEEFIWLEDNFVFSNVKEHKIASCKYSAEYVLEGL